MGERSLGCLNYIDSSDEFELNFPELKGFRAEPSLGISIFELKPSCRIFPLKKKTSFACKQSAKSSQYVKKTRKNTSDKKGQFFYFRAMAKRSRAKPSQAIA